jgi:anti-sigma28 factor (negative regulator of flagellin synthesis)
VRITEINPDLVRSEQPSGGKAPGADSVEEGAATPPPKVCRATTLKISDAARKLAADDVPRQQLTPERIAEIRQRILAGTYDSLESVEKVARRMLASGDL